ncbi:MAG TPA: nuclear transport factor 2 family protein [Candidatus Nanoarchaeia archaeon]|nr:nuclear transport factor 2 family protein [Candidatus Nanoarchaeia archaeon]
MTLLSTHKQSATSFLNLIIAGKIDEAYEKYVNLQGKHHNAYFPAGFPVLKKAMMEAHIQSPNKQFTIKNVLEDGDLVAVHSHLIINPGEKGMITLHMFRFKDNKIVEMWDCGQPIPNDSPNKDGAF